MGNGKVYAMIVLIRLIYAGMHILTKASFEEGMSTTVFVFYRHAVAAIFLAPFAVFEIRKRPAPPLTLRLSVKIFVHAFYGMAGTINLYSIGLNYASATSSSAIFNIVPVVAFILAVMFRMETLKLKSVHGMAKASGILLCIGGVVALALYQGPQLKSLNHHPLLHSTGKAVHAQPEKNWALGIFLMTASVVIWSLWTVKQGPLLLEYPSKLLNTTLQCAFASVQSFIIALVMERDLSRWKLAGGMTLVAVLFTGIVVAAISYYLQIWVIEKKGPVFLSMSMPLSLVFTMAIASFLLGEDVSLGRYVRPTSTSKSATTTKLDQLHKLLVAPPAQVHHHIITLPNKDRGIPYPDIFFSPVKRRVSHPTKTDDTAAFIRCEMRCTYV
uniref:Uncharacterized protein n=1 Tax=Avena sativa TaxID=4498 RepID=A0ACD5UMR7_AVESA